MIFYPQSIAFKPNYRSPSNIANASLIAIGNATNNNKFVHILKTDWTGNDTRNNSLSPHNSYTPGNSPHLSVNRLYSMTIPPNSLIKVKKPSKSFIYISGGTNGLYNQAEPDQFTSVTKIGYTD